MPRYFLEVSYKGDNYSGFQVQENATTIQSEVEKAFNTFFRKPVSLTGSSRTDAGVHALQNFFHFDWEEEFQQKSIYNINSILPADIAIKSAKLVKADAHSRFSAVSREYEYFISFSKNPFMNDRAWFFPYQVNEDLLHQAAAFIKENDNFMSFSKQHTQVKTFQCQIEKSIWTRKEDSMIYTVKANRFLRGMVRALVSTMLQVARENITIQEFKTLLEGKLKATADFSAPAKGLFLTSVSFKKDIFL